MKNLLIVLSISLLTISLSSQERLMIDKVIAKVGTQTILLSDVESQYAYAIEKSGGLTDGLKCQILQSLIGQKLIVHHAKLDSVEISNEEIEASLDFRIDGVLRQMNGDEAFFEEFYGMPISEMRENLRDDLEQQMLAERMQNKIISEVKITPKEIKAFYRSIPKDSIPFLSAEVEISEIVVKPEVNKEERIKALEQILKIRKSILEGGESFEDLAKKYSGDTGSGIRGGDLGFAKRGTFVQEFEAVAYGLEVDEVSEPVETQFGFHIIKMIERRGNNLHLKHILITPEITEDDKILAKERLDTIRNSILEGTISFSDAVKKHSIEDIPSYHNNGMIQNPKTGKTFFETGDLPTEIYFAVEDMEIGDISTPLEYPLPTGETYYRIVQLHSKTKPHRASLEEDYTKIQSFAKESKKQEYFAKWLEEKVKDTFIEVDDSYISCPDLDNMIKGLN